VIVPPAAPATAVASPQTLDVGNVTWDPSPNALGYQVEVHGKQLCDTTGTSCNVPAAIGPKTPVDVIAIGNDDTKNQVKPEIVIEKPIPALTVNFPLASYMLSKTAKAEIKSVAQVIKSEGFTRLIVTGHTDALTGVNNNTLSKERADATVQYLQKILPNVQFKIGAYAAKKPVADNSTPSGQAQNRRAEISVW
jgi:outer membrane protein OmpA-like peptidoglycan-associated protein